MKRILSILLLLLISHFLVAQKVGYRGYSRTKSQSSELSYTNPQEYEIAEIKVNGAEFLDHNALISLSGLEKGDVIKIPGDEISAAVKKLWKQGLIGEISISIDKIE